MQLQPQRRSLLLTRRQRARRGTESILRSLLLLVELLLGRLCRLQIGSVAGLQQRSSRPSARTVC